MGALPIAVLASWLNVKSIAIAMAVVAGTATLLVIQSADDAGAPADVPSRRAAPPPPPERAASPAEPRAPELSAQGVEAREPASGDATTRAERPAAGQERSARPSGSPASFSDEVALVERARAELEHRPRTALALSRQYRREYPGGQLQLECEAIHIEALWRMGRRGPARRAAAAFLRAHPQAPYVDRIRPIAEGAPARRP
jgi:hypothetical protein